MSDSLGTALIVVNTLFAAVNNSQVKEILSTFSYKSDLQGLDDTVTIVRNMLLDLDNESRKRILTKTERCFMQKLKEVLDDADDLFDKFVTLAEQLRDCSGSKKVRHFFSSKNPLIVARSMSQGVKKIREEFACLRYGFSSRVSSDDFLHFKRIDTGEGTHPYVDAGNVIGRDDDAKEIIDRLLNSTDDVGFLTIVGMGGSGKTTLSQLVFNDGSIASEFPMRSWICVADQDESSLDVTKILSNILDSVGFELESVNRTSFEYIRQEYERNLGGEKFLLVLDDIWTENPIEWKKLSNFLMMGGKGSRIIATTRSKKTATIIGNDTYELKGLSDEHSWHLFQMMAFGGQSIPPDFVEISQNIVKKCSNLPLAIKVVGRLIFGETIQKFRSLLKRLVKFDEFPYKHNRTMTILRVSYDQLTSSLRCCFSYCAIFPKDSIIKKEVLMNLWEAHGYIVPFYEGQSIEDAGEEHFATLLQRSFFQNVKMNEYGSVESVKMHDLMHDLAQRVSGMGYSACHIFNCTLIKEDDFFIHSKTRSYLMFRKRFETGNESTPLPLSKIVNKPLCLRALALQGLRLSSLPDTMDKLLHLRYLNLAKNS